MSSLIAEPFPLRVDRSRLRPPGIVRLVRVEMRKMVDTRSGFWLLIALAAISVLFVVVGIFAGHPSDRTFPMFFQGTLYPVAILLPVLGILMITSEFSQRTTLATFALVPHRGRVMVAKFLAGIVYVLLSIVTSLVTAAIGYAIANALGRTDGTDWKLGGLAIGGAVLYQMINVLGGLAFGLLLMNTPAAIVANFVAPTALTIITSAIHSLEKALTWIDITAASGPLTDASMTTTDWRHLATATLVWIVLPILLGSWRLARRELK